MNYEKLKHVVSFANSSLRRRILASVVITFLTCCPRGVSDAAEGGIPKEVQDLKAVVVTVQTQVGSLESANTSLKTTIAALQAQLVNLESANQILQNTVTELQTQDASHNSTLASLQSRLNAVEQSVKTESFQASAANVDILDDGADHLIAKLDLPPGNYVVMAKGNSYIFGGNRGLGVYRINGPGGEYDETAVSQNDDDSRWVSVALLTNISLPNGGTISVAGSTLTDGVVAQEFKLIAVKVSALH
jgi:hypothetical protein